MERRAPFNRSSSSSTVDNDASVPNYSPDHLIHDPLCSGFLLKHCEDQFSDENMLFVIAVDRFRDYFLRDVNAWPSDPWRKLDEEHLATTPTPETESLDELLVGLQDPDFFPENTWPSNIVSRDAIREIIAKIIKEYLIKDATKWICISQTMLSNTIKRIRLLHIYGREAFSESLFDPLRTIERDIYPRFQTSLPYRRMVETKQLLEKKAYIEKLRLPKPDRQIQNKYPKVLLQQGGKILFTLQEILEDGTLYEEFHRYLEGCYSSENLKCIRAVTIYKDTFPSDAKDRPTPASVEYAVLIYRYFVAPRAPCEICVSHVHINDILRGLAKPNVSLFDMVERSAFAALQQHFNSFRHTPQYLHLSRAVINHSRLPPVNGIGNSANASNSLLQQPTSSSTSSQQPSTAMQYSASAGTLLLPRTLTHPPIQSNYHTNGQHSYTSSSHGSSTGAGGGIPAISTGLPAGASSNKLVTRHSLFGTCFPIT